MSEIRKFESIVAAEEYVSGMLGDEHYHYMHDTTEHAPTNSATKVDLIVIEHDALKVFVPGVVRYYGGEYITVEIY
jgi:hypothetical protein